jgi:iron complex outermembrane receptor protein
MTTTTRNSLENRKRLLRTGAPLALLCGFAAVAMAPTAASAEAAAQPAAAGAAPATELGEVIVTARRRSEDLSRVPTAVAAFSGQQLIERSVRTDSDLQHVTPGLTVRQTQGVNSLTYSIRGQSADTFSGSPSAVVVYLNEVPLTTSAATSFYDLESAQVLKGPQGTLFGRNATGGAVLYSSAKPTNDYEGSLQLRAGNLQMFEGLGMVNLPIVQDKVLFRAAFDLLSREGYIDNLYTGQKLGDVRRQSGRASLTLKPTDNITNTTTYQLTHAGGTNTGASYLYSAYSCGQTNNGFALNCAAGSLFGPQLDQVTGAGSWDAYLAAHPKAFPGGVIAYLDEQKRLGPYKSNYIGDETHRENDWFISNVTNAEVSDSLTLRNIFGASRSWYHSESSSQASPFGIFTSENPDQNEFGNSQLANSISEEFQVQGKALDNNLTYIVGGYYQHLKVDTNWPQSYFNVSPIIPASNVSAHYRTTNDTKAIYAQGTYDLGTLTGVQGLRFTGGVRYTWESVDFEHLPGSAYYGSPKQSRDFSDPSWEVGLEYQATPSVFTYVKTRGSFRSGGFNGAAPAVDADATGGGNKFNSEHTQDIEGGVKFRGQIAGRPSSINVAAFNQWIQDVQRVEFPAVPGGSIAVTVNVPAARIHGLEADATVLATPWLEIGGSGSLIKGKFTKPNVELFGTSYTYGPFADTPKASGVLYGQATLHDSEAVGKFTLRAEVYAQTSVYFSSSADSLTPGTKLPGYALVNARFGWDNLMGRDGLSADLFARNLFDKAYFTGGIPLGASLGVNNASVGEPRTYGVELTAKF